MKGISPVIAEILLIIITISIIIVSFYFYQTRISESGEEIWGWGEKVYCAQSSNFMILEVEETNITVKNNGGTKLNLENFRVYLNAENIGIDNIEKSGKAGILDIGETAVIVLGNSVSVDDTVRIVGGCKTGDELRVFAPPTPPIPPEIDDPPLVVLISPENNSVIII